MLQGTFASRVQLTVNATTDRTRPEEYPQAEFVFSVFLSSHTMIPDCVNLFFSSDVTSPKANALTTPPFGLTFCDWTLRHLASASWFSLVVRCRDSTAIAEGYTTSIGPSLNMAASARPPASTSSSSSLILDPGSSSVKFGPGTESLPVVVVGSVVGRPVKKKKGLLSKSSAAETGSEVPAHVFGQDALSYGGQVTLSNPIERANVVIWEDMDQILNHCFQESGVEAERHGLVVALPSFGTRELSERFAQACFESFDMKHFAIANQGLCALYASGRTTGLVLESGDGVTTITPVYDSFVLPVGLNRINIGGSDVTKHLKRLMFERGYNFTSQLDTHYLNTVKEGQAYVAMDYKGELESPDEVVAVDLPDGQTINVGRERFRCAEILFDSTILQSELPSMSAAVTTAIKRCAIDVRRDLSSSIVLSGGNTLLTGFGARLRSEVATNFPGMFGSVSVVEPPDRKFNVWGGAAVLSNLSSFEDHIITRDLYDEVGPSIVHSFSASKRKGDLAADDADLTGDAVA